MEIKLNIETSVIKATNRKLKAKWNISTDPLKTEFTDEALDELTDILNKEGFRKKRIKYRNIDESWNEF